MSFLKHHHHVDHATRMSILMKMPWDLGDNRDPLDVPDCLKRDKNNVAPFMKIDWSTENTCPIPPNYYAINSGECPPVGGLLCRRNYPGASACTRFGGLQQCINPEGSLRD